MVAEEDTGIWYLESRDAQCPSVYSRVPYGDELSCPQMPVAHLMHFADEEMRVQRAEMYNVLELL